MGFVSKISKRVKVVKRSLSIFAPKDPVYVFHHIPKCGGTSLNTVLDNWFITIMDYRSGWTMNYPNKVDVSRLRSCHCLCGHFELDGYYLHQRYPEIFMSNRYRVLTFVRDPLQVQLSLFRYEKIHNQLKVKNIEDYLSVRANYLADRFPATLANYKDVVDRYFFVGILEEREASLSVLASMMDKHSVAFPWLNKSRKDFVGNAEAEDISKELIKRFRDENVLDYLIYDYCVEKFKKISAEQSVAPKGE